MVSGLASPQFRKRVSRARELGSTGIADEG